LNGIGDTDTDEVITERVSVNVKLSEERTEVVDVFNL
jgi:hypothetical protein